MRWQLRRIVPKSDMYSYSKCFNPLLCIVLLHPPFVQALLNETYSICIEIGELLHRLKYMVVRFVVRLAEFESHGENRAIRQHGYVECRLEVELILTWVVITSSTSASVGKWSK